MPETSLQSFEKTWFVSAFDSLPKWAVIADTTIHDIIHVFRKTYPKLMLLGCKISEQEGLVYFNVDGKKKDIEKAMLELNGRFV